MHMMLNAWTKAQQLLGCSWVRTTFNLVKISFSNKSNGNCNPNLIKIISYTKQKGPSLSTLSSLHTSLSTSHIWILTRFSLGLLRASTLWVPWVFYRWCDITWRNPWKKLFYFQSYFPQKLTQKGLQKNESQKRSKSKTRMYLLTRRD